MPVTRRRFWLAWGVAMTLLAGLVILGLPGDEVAPDARAEAPTLTRAVH